MAGDGILTMKESFEFMAIIQVRAPKLVLRTVRNVSIVRKPLVTLKITCRRALASFSFSVFILRDEERLGGWGEDEGVCFWCKTGWGSGEMGLGLGSEWDKLEEGKWSLQSSKQAHAGTGYMASRGRGAGPIEVRSNLMRQLLKWWPRFPQLKHKIGSL